MAAPRQSRGGGRSAPCYGCGSARKPLVRETPMPRATIWTTVAAIAASLTIAIPAAAQKSGGVLRVYHRDSPASMSIHEEGSISVIMPMMGVFNNLVIFDQHVRQNSMQSIVPELATEWAWSEDGKDLTFKLRDGVK